MESAPPAEFTIEPEDTVSMVIVDTPLADELAAKLANPANPIMKIGNNFDYVAFDGDLPGAGDQ